MSKYRDIQQLIRDAVNNQIDQINEKLQVTENPPLINKISFKHIINRMNEREIDIADIVTALRRFKNERLVEFIYLSKKSPQTFKIEIKGENVILALGRHDENWRFATVLDPKIHSKYKSETVFCQRINLGQNK